MGFFSVLQFRAWRMRLFFPAIVLHAVLVGCATPSRVPSHGGIGEDPSSHGSHLDQQLDILTSQIVASLQQDQKSKVAVVEFMDLAGSVTALGQYISEELITRLYLTGQFQVIERNLLQKVIEEHELTLSGLVDEASARELGRILGVDAIASGSVTDLGTSVKVNARLISTETGSIFSVAAVEIQKDPVVARLLAGHGGRSDTPTHGVIQAPMNEEEVTSAPGNDYFYYEDFAQVQDGHVPESWIGGDKTLVRRQGKTRVLTNFEGLKDRTRQKLTIMNVPFPEDFRLEWTYKQVTGCDHWLEVGAIRVFVGMCWGMSRNVIYKLGESQKVIPGGLRGQRVPFAIEKRGSVVRLYAYGNEILVTRYQSAARPSSISLTAESTFELHQIVGRRLGG